jgi:hypothetical protein
MRRSTRFLILTATGLLLLGLTFVHAAWRQATGQEERAQVAALVRTLELTDLCLFTEARYSRHPAMADLSTPFQDYPMSMEHYPSGALMSPPPHLRRRF